MQNEISLNQVKESRDMFSHVSPYYCDYNATTPLPSELIEASATYLKNNWFNPSSTYINAIDQAKTNDKLKQKISKLLVGKSADTIICSSASEAISQAIYSLALSYPGYKLVITDSEHSAVKKAANKWFSNKVHAVSSLKLSMNDFSEFKKLQDTKENFLVFIQSANNETGLLNPVKEIRQILGNEVVLILDASQSLGKQSDFLEVFSYADALILSPHKFYGPKGVGLLVWSKKIAKLEPLIMGGGQQAGLRGGTENTPLLNVLGKWIEMLPSLVEDFKAVENFRNKVESSILDLYPSIEILKSSNGRLSNTTTIHVPEVLADQLVSQLDGAGIMASSGSACNSGTTEPSKSYLSMGYTWDQARCIFRLSFGFANLNISPIEISSRIVDSIKLSRN